MINEPFGWLWALAGFVSGAFLGARFSDDEWFGGYSSHRRRLLRLGHISFLGLGILNILFAHSLERIQLGPTWLALASWAMVVGAITMPLCCGLVAWRRGLRPVFVVPVACLLIGGTLVTVGILKP